MTYIALLFVASLSQLDVTLATPPGSPQHAADDLTDLIQSDFKTASSPASSALGTLKELNSTELLSSEDLAKKLCSTGSLDALEHEFDSCKTNELACPCAVDAPIFAISGRTSPRRETLTKQLERLCPKECMPHFKFVDATNMSNLTEVQQSTQFTEVLWGTGSLNKPDISESLKKADDSPWCHRDSGRCGATQPEMVVASSHLKAIWTAYSFLQKSPDYTPRVALVVEDDVDLSPAQFWQHKSLQTWLTNANLPSDWNVVQMCRGFQNESQVVAAQDASKDIVARKTSTIFGAVAILYSEQGMRKILDEMLVKGSGESSPKFRLDKFSFSLLSDVMIYDKLGDSAWMASPPLFLHPVDGLGKSRSEMAANGQHCPCEFLMQYRLRDVTLMRTKWGCGE